MQHSMRNILKYILLIVCLGFIVRYFLTYTDEFSQLANISPQFILILIAFGVLSHSIMGLKLFMILKKQGLVQLNFMRWFKIFTISRFINYHITQGGNIYRSITLKKQYQFPYTQSISCITLFTWLESVFMLILTIAIIARTIPDLTLLGINTLLLTGVLLLLFLLIPFGGEKILKLIHLANERLKWAHTKVSDVTREVKDVITDIPFIGQMFVINIVSFFVFIIFIYTAFVAIGSSINFLTMPLFTVLTQLSGILNITPGNLGITEIIYGVLATESGSSIGAGILACGILRVIWYITIFCLNLFYLKDIAADWNMITKHKHET